MSSTSFLLGKQVKTKTNMLLDIYYGGSLNFMIGLHRAIDLHMQIPGHTGTYKMSSGCRICTDKKELPEVNLYINVS